MNPHSSRDSQTTFGFVFSFVLLASFLASGIAFGQTSKPIFPVTPLIGASTNFISPAIADFNGDGVPDLAYVSTPSLNGVMQFSLNIDLGFAGKTPTISTTSLCSSQVFPEIAVGDVNKDGKPDVVATCNGYVMVLFGNGDGTFQKPSYYPLNSTNAPVLVDLNGDGYPDIAVSVPGTTGTSPTQVAVFINKGTSGPGVYGSPQMYLAANTDALGLTAGDFNGDGKQDLITSTDSGLVLLFGNGDGTLQTAQPQAFSGAPCITMVAGDFNRDGATDLACAPLHPLGTTPPVQVLFGSTSGTLVQGPILQPEPTNSLDPIANIATADLNGDGNLDLIVGNDLTYIFLGDGKGNFTQASSYSVSGYPMVADVNGDGKPDLTLAGTGPNTGVLTVLGNGDGTFQAAPGTHVSGPAADVNGDGIADMLYLIPGPGSQSTSNFIGTALGRGDGTFAALNQTVSIPGTSLGSYFLDPGDFNGDGKVDVVAIQTGFPGEPCSEPDTPQDAELFSYLGNGDGTFQAKGTGVDLTESIITGPGIVGDFNGDGKLDLLLPFYLYVYSFEDCGNSEGVAFFPGNGDGTFGAPVESSPSPGNPASTSMVSGDLNRDGKLDFIWAYNNAVYLGNGDGTFKQMPLDIQIPPNSPLALADLNGDGILDLVVGPNVYAGNGDGTFQTTPFYTVPLPQNSTVLSVAAGDVNGDGNPDLLEAYDNPANGTARDLSVSLGDGRGSFTQDPHNYFLGTETQYPAISGVALTRLNNNAPKSQNQALDLLASINGVYASSMLNQLNPPPAKPSPIPSTTTLQVSPTSGGTGMTIALTASVTGIDPTGSVSFAANGTNLGSAPITNGTAALNTSFANAGNYTVTAAYAGDPNNSPSTSNSVAVTIAVPDFKISAQPSSATVSPGQSATYTFTVTPTAGYNGTVSFSCGSLPAAATCSFSPASVTPTNGAAATTTLTIATTAPSTSMSKSDGPVAPWMPVGALTVAGIFGFAITPRKTRYWNRFLRGCSGLFLLAALFLTLNGCGSGSHAPSNPGTPPGSYSVSVSASGSAGGPQHSMPVTLTVQ